MRIYFCTDGVIGHFRFYVPEISKYYKINIHPFRKFHVPQRQLIITTIPLFFRTSIFELQHLKSSVCLLWWVRQNVDLGKTYISQIRVAIIEGLKVCTCMYQNIRIGLQFETLRPCTHPQSGLYLMVAITWIWINIILSFSRGGKKRDKNRQSIYYIVCIYYPAFSSIIIVIRAQLENLRPATHSHSCCLLAWWLDSSRKYAPFRRVAFRAHPRCWLPSRPRCTTNTNSLSIIITRYNIWVNDRQFWKTETRLFWMGELRSILRIIFKKDPCRPSSYSSTFLGYILNL